jgi:hypothetical protein
MARKFRNKIRIKVGGTMNYETGVMSGGVVVGHFAADYDLSVERPVLTSRIAAGPTVQKIDPDDETCTLNINLEQDSVAARNLSYYAVDGGPVEVSTADAIDQKVLDKYGVFEFGGFGQSGSKEAAKEKATLIGTNSLAEATWMAAQADLPDGGGG